MPAPTVAVKGFAAGVLSVLTVMAAVWWLLQAAGFLPARALPLWSLTPRIPPFGVPRVVNLAFWGGVWGLVLSLLFRELSGAIYWLSWLLAGAISIAATGLFLVPMIKGLAMPPITPQRLALTAMIDGAFGLGAGLWLTILGRPGR